MDTIIEQAQRIQGRLELPGDKSIAHRALIFGAMAVGKQTISNLPPSEDVAATLSCLRVLGCRVEDKTGGRVEVTPGEWANHTTLNAKNSGTTARLLSGLVAGCGITCTLDGDDSLRKRPMDRIKDPLARMGARIRTTKGCLPMHIEGGDLQGITYAPSVASAQVKSAVLIAGVLGSGRTCVIEKAQTRDHTENLFTAMGVPVERDGLCVSVEGGARLEGVHVIVPNDISSALFFVAAALLLPDSELRLLNVGVNPTRTGALSVLENMGACLERENLRIQAGEPTADLVIRTSRLCGVDIRGAVIPTLIDELPILAVLATQAEGTFRVQDAKELRYKESDRIHGIVRNLKRLGAKIEEYEDGFEVKGPCSLQGAEVFSLGDHRMAMAMAVAGLVAKGKTRIRNSEAVAVSYPDFFKDLHALVG
jgi:3-phosphoshikimate 1-carboxyvinyltransferase